MQGDAGSNQHEEGYQYIFPEKEREAEADEALSLY